jgi:hypothetical protein
MLGSGPTHQNVVLRTFWLEKGDAPGFNVTRHSGLVDHRRAVWLTDEVEAESSQYGEVKVIVLVLPTIDQE